MLLIAAFVLFFISETIRSERRRLYGTSTVIMEMDKTIIPGLSNGTRIYSPITLSKEWSSLARLAVMVVTSCFGATMNGYFVTSFIVNQQLYCYDYLFHCCLGVADMLVTSGVIPIATVVLLSGVWDIHPVCQGLQTLTAASTYSYSILFAMVACQNYIRVTYCSTVQEKNTKSAIAFTAFIVFAFSIILAIFGTYWRLDYDYCERRYYGDLRFRQATFLLIHGTCLVITMTALMSCRKKIQREKRLAPVYRQIHLQFDELPGLIRLNIISYILYVAAWTPYVIVVNFYPHMPDRIYYKYAWLGVGRTLITSSLYGSLGKTFGGFYSNIFKYCCCKISLNGSSRARHIAKHFNTDRAPKAAEVRTHIMQQAVNPNISQRALSSTRETIEL